MGENQEFTSTLYSRRIVGLLKAGGHEHLPSLEDVRQVVNKENDTKLEDWFNNQLQNGEDKFETLLDFFWHDESPSR